MSWRIIDRLQTRVFTKTAIYLPADAYWPYESAEPTPWPDVLLPRGSAGLMTELRKEPWGPYVACVRFDDARLAGHSYWIDRDLLDDPSRAGPVEVPR